MTSKIKQCEICDEEKPLIRYMTMMVCASCMQKEMNAQQHLENTASERVEEQKLDILARQVQIDHSIKLDTDLFNAATVSIVEMKQAIDDDETIDNKKYELATRLVERHKHFSDVIFKLQAKTAEFANAQRSIQQYLNEFTNQLRQEEREKLRLQDFNYQPKPPAKPTKPRTPGKKKFVKADLAKYAAELDVAPHTIQAICVAQNLTPEGAANFLKELKAKV